MAPQWGREGRANLGWQTRTNHVMMMVDGIKGKVMPITVGIDYVQMSVDQTDSIPHSLFIDRSAAFAHPATAMEMACSAGPATNEALAPEIHSQMWRFLIFS